MYMYAYIYIYIYIYIHFIAKNVSPNTNDLYIHYMDRSTGTPPSLEEKRHFQTVATKMET